MLSTATHEGPVKGPSEGDSVISGTAEKTADIIQLFLQGRGNDAIARMASCTPQHVRAVLTEALASRPVGAHRSIPLDKILVLEGRRPISPNKVESIAESIDHSGLINPITVRENKNGTGFILIAGLHRMGAYRRLGRKRIPAFVKPASITEADARMLEISENLQRAELTVLQRSQQTAEWIELAKEKSLEGGTRAAERELGELAKEERVSAQVAKKPQGGRPESGVNAASRELGISKDEAYRAVKIASMTPEAQEAARKAGIDDNQSKLLEAAGEAPERQVEAVYKLAGRRSIMASRHEPDDSLDLFPTPPWATRALMERVMPQLEINPTTIGKMWEPACGHGHMSGVLAEYGTVYASDIYNYGSHLDQVVDFLDPAGEVRAADWIITNPPFGDKTMPFVLRAIELAHVGVAMFVRLQWLEGIERFETIFRDRPPTFVCPFVERVNLCKGRWDPDGTTATAYALAGLDERPRSDAGAVADVLDCARMPRGDEPARGPISVRGVVNADARARSRNGDSAST